MPPCVRIAGVERMLLAATYSVTPSLHLMPQSGQPPNPRLDLAYLCGCEQSRYRYVETATHITRRYHFHTYAV